MAILEWMFGYVGGKTADFLWRKISATNFETTLLQTVEQWRKALPDEMFLASRAALFPIHLPDEALDDRPGLLGLREAIRACELPTHELLFNALLEQWRSVASQSGEQQLFFEHAESDASPFIEDLSKRLARVCAQNPDFFGPEILKQLETHKNDIRAIRSTVEELAGASVDRFIGLDELANPELETCITEFERFRLVPEFRAIERAQVLAHRILNGNLGAASSDVRAAALGWCARILSGPTTRDHAEKILNAAKTLPSCDTLEIARALFADDFGSGAVHEALTRLASPASLSAALINRLNTATPLEAIDWLGDADIHFEDLDASAKSLLIARLIEDNLWTLASDYSGRLSEPELDRFPLLAEMTGMACVAMASPEEDRHVLRSGIPFEPELFRLSDDLPAISQRARAIECFDRANKLYLDANLKVKGRATKAMSLWLRLRSDTHKDCALEELNRLVRDPEHALIVADLALRFGADVTPEQIRQVVRRDESLTGELRSEAAIALLSSMLCNPDPSSVANELSATRSKFETVLDPTGLVLLEVQALCKAGRIDDAENRVQSQDGLHPDMIKRLHRIISEAKGSDPAEARRAAFEDTGSLADLDLLVEALEKKGDPVQLATYSGQLYERNKTLRSAAIYLRALDQSGQGDNADAFLAANLHFAELASNFAERWAQVLYFKGRYQELFAFLAIHRARHDSDTFRHLFCSACIETGRWADLNGFAQSEFDNRTGRTSPELLRAAQLVLQANPRLARGLVEAAVAASPESADILASAYFMASGANWEKDDHVATWLKRAADLSGEDGPIQTADLQDLIDRQPEWNAHENNIWEAMTKAQLPIPMAAKALNRSLISMTLSNALANRNTQDVRRRAGVPAFHGRQQLPLDRSKPMSSIVVDPVAPLILADLGLLNQLEAMFEHMVVPHGLLSLYFQNMQSAAFHQPSRVRHAQRILDAVVRGHIQQILEAPKSEPWLIEEAGFRLAALLTEGRRLSVGQDRPVRIVHPGAVKKATSLGRETANLRAYSDILSGCQPLVKFLRERGQLSRPEFESASAFLRLQGELPDKSHSAIEDRSILLLDGLALSYLTDLELLAPLFKAGLSVIVLSDERRDADAIVQYDVRAADIAKRIEDIRSFLEKGIASGFVSVAERGPGKAFESDFDVILSALHAASDCDGYLCDDRAVNVHGFSNGPTSPTPIITSLDLINDMLTKGLITRSQWFGAKHNLRTGGYLLVPVDADDLRYALEEAFVSDNVLVETAELRAIREYLAQICMADWLQMETENAWVSNLFGAIRSVFHEIWRETYDPAEASSKSDWLLALFDIRDWLRFRKFEVFELANVRAAQLGFFIGLGADLPPTTRSDYSSWADTRIVEPTKLSEPDVYRAILKMNCDLLASMLEQHAGDFHV